MKRMFLVLLITCTIALTAACGQGNQSATKNDKNTAAVGESSSQSNEYKRISFDIDNKENVSYKQHITDLWEKTKPLLREDIANNYTDEQYKKLGTEINQAWVNLQIHSSLHHKDECNSIKYVKFANLDGNVIELIDELYGNRSGTKEKHEKSRETLKKGRLEYKIKEFDAILQRAD